MTAPYGGGGAARPAAGPGCQRVQLAGRRAQAPAPATILDALERDNHDIYRGWLLVEQLRTVYEAASWDDAMVLLDDWVLAALTSDLEPFVRCALTIDADRDLVVNAITERLSNARLEGMNSTVRLLSHRARG